MPSAESRDPNQHETGCEAGQTPSQAPLDPLHVPSRLNELRQMQDGWLDGSSKAPRHDGLDWLTSAFAQHFPDDLPLPHLYPTPEGEIASEWDFAIDTVILTFDIDARRGEWLGIDEASEAGEDRSLDLNRADQWQWVTDQIRRLYQEDD